MTEPHNRVTGKGWWLAIGAVLVAGAAWIGIPPGPGSTEGQDWNLVLDEAAGTIMQAERHQAETTLAGEAASEANEVSGEGLSAEQLVEADASQADADRALAGAAANAVNTGKGGDGGGDITTQVCPPKC